MCSRVANGARRARVQGSLAEGGRAKAGSTLGEPGSNISSDVIGCGRRFVDTDFLA